MTTFAYGRKGGDPYSIDRLKQTIAESGVPGLRVTSALRIGSITSSGQVSNHARGLAIDVVGSKDAMGKYAAFLKSTYGPYLLELIYRGPAGSFMIHNGTPTTFSESLMRAHENHVHVAGTLAGLDARKNAGTLPAPSTPVDTVITPVGVTDDIKDGVKQILGIVRKLEGIGDLWEKAKTPEGSKKILITTVGYGIVVVGLLVLAAPAVKKGAKVGVAIATKGATSGD